MQITIPLLQARRKEVEVQKAQYEMNLNACIGALQVLDALIETAKAPEAPTQNEQKSS